MRKLTYIRFFTYGLIALALLFPAAKRLVIPVSLVSRYFSPEESEWNKKYENKWRSPSDIRRLAIALAITDFPIKRDKALDLLFYPKTAVASEYDYENGRYFLVIYLTNPYGDSDAYELHLQCKGGEPLNRKDGEFESSTLFIKPRNGSIQFKCVLDEPTDRHSAWIIAWAKDCMKKWNFKPAEAAALVDSESLGLDLPALVSLFESKTAQPQAKKQSTGSTNGGTTDPLAAVTNRIACLNFPPNPHQDVARISSSRPGCSYSRPWSSGRRRAG